MKAFYCLLVLVFVIQSVFCHLFYHDIMSDDDATYGIPGIRTRRDTYDHEGSSGPLYTHVRTDFDGNFKWGAKHMVGAMVGDGKDDEDNSDF